MSLLKAYQHTKSNEHLANYYKKNYTNLDGLSLLDLEDDSHIELAPDYEYFFFFFRKKMAQYSNCFLFDEFKLYSKVGFFELRKEMVIFMLNTILNIQKYFLDFCKCDGNSICLVCEIGEIFNKNLTYEIYKNCLNLNLMSKIST